MNKYKKDFPIFSEKLKKEFNKIGLIDESSSYINKNFNYENFAYLDSAATSMICENALRGVVEYEMYYRSNVHRGAHYLANKSTELYEEARKTIAKFINATVPSEIVFTKGATDGSNLIANSWGKHNLRKGDVILLSDSEHSSNSFPWESLADEIGCEINYIPTNKKGFLDLKSIKTDWTRVRVVAFPYVSNVLGVINSPKEVSKYVKKRVIEAKKLKGSDKNKKKYYPIIVLDGSQAVGKLPINVQKLGIDFLFFSGHKMYGPMGTGVLWMNRDLLNNMYPYQTGGGMLDGYKEKIFEVGTPNVSGAIGLSLSAKYIESIGFDNIREHELEILKYTFQKMEDMGCFDIYGSKNPNEKSGVISFNAKNIPAHDLAAILDVEGVAIRAGYHCVLKWHKDNKYYGTARISFGIYTTKSDIDKFLKAVDKAYVILGMKK